MTAAQAGMSSPASPAPHTSDSKAMRGPATKKDDREEMDEDWSAVVTVLAGQNKTSFTVHCKFLCDNSDFFRMALSGPWIESQESKVTLPEIDPMSFKIYLSWIYSHKLDRKSLEVGKKAGWCLAGDCKDGDEHTRIEAFAQILEGSGEACAGQFDPEDEYFKRPALPFEILKHRLVRLWIHGDFLGDRKFQAAVADAFVDEFASGHREIFFETLCFLGENTTPECPLRKTIVDWVAANQHIYNYMPVFRENAPEWLLADLLRR